MGKIRILCVDDAVVIRRLVSHVLASDPALEVVGTAANGRIALAKIPQVNPDVVLLDIEMPELDGLQTLALLRKTYTRLPVIMYSVLTQRGAATTMDALALGATDYVTKPSSAENLPAAIQRIREELIPKIKNLCPHLLPTVRLSTQSKLAAPSRSSARTVVLLKRQRVEVVVIGASTGGPNALAQVLPKLPLNFPVPVLVVQHMPPAFTKLLADRLATQCLLNVAEAKTGETLTPGKIWIAPGDHHLTVNRNGPMVLTALHQGPPENSCRPAVDVLFRTAVEVYSSGVLGVVLTGMGQDGLHGSARIADVGGQILVQDEDSSVVWGMPGFVARAGIAEEILPLEQIAPEIIRRAFRGRSVTAQYS